MVPGPADRLALVEGARLLVEAMEVRHLAAIFAATPDVVVSNLLRPPGEPVMSCLGWRRLPSSGGTRHRAETWRTSRAGVCSRGRAGHGWLRRYMRSRARHSKRPLWSPWRRACCGGLPTRWGCRVTPRESCSQVAP